MLCLVDGKLYTLFISSSLFLVAVTVQSLPPSSLYPWSTGVLLVVIVSVPFLCTVTPSFSGWNIVMYPLFDSLCTLINDCCRCRSMCASLALLICQNGRDILFVIRWVSTLGRWTVLFDFPSSGKSMSLLQKCDLAPESMTICFSGFLAILLSHLFDFGVSLVGVLWILLASLISLSVSSSLD
jgi:hypothetical protein